MVTKIDWSARVKVPLAEVDEVLRFATEVERGLKLSGLVPEDAKVVKVDTFMGEAACVVEWHTENEMAYEPNYTP